MILSFDANSFETVYIIFYTINNIYIFIISNL